MTAEALRAAMAAPIADYRTKAVSTDHVSLDVLRATVHYDKETGQFTWLKVTRSHAGKAQVAGPAGSVHPNGFLRICIGGREHPAHQLAVFYASGVWPKEKVRHVNGNMADNRLVNLVESRGSLKPKKPKERAPASGIPLLTAGELRAILDYDPDTGLFTTKATRNGTTMPAGSVVGGSGNSCGYFHVCIRGRKYLLHRLAWLFVNGEWPAADLDHINRIKTDNRIANLRETDGFLNQQNVVLPRVDNKFGLRGVSRNAYGFLAKIRCGGKAINLGTYRTPEEAHAAYVAAKRQLHPEVYFD